MTIIWCMIPEIWVCHARLNLDHFLPFYPTNNLKNQNFEKLKKTPGDTTILHKCTKNHDHMLHWSWDMACDRYNCYFSFGAISCPFTVWKKKFKKWRKQLEISFYKSVLKILIIGYTFPEIWHVTNVILIFHFELFFFPFTTLTAQKIKFSIKWKKQLETSSFYTCVLKIMIKWCMVPEIWCVTNRQTDGKIDTQRWVPHLKIYFLSTYMNKSNQAYCDKYFETNWHNIKNTSSNPLFLYKL